MSTRTNGRPAHVVSAITRSRVVPATSETMASRRPVSRLNRVDLPTLGLPTMATTGLLDTLFPSAYLLLRTP